MFGYRISEVYSLIDFIPTTLWPSLELCLQLLDSLYHGRTTCLNDGCKKNQFQHDSLSPIDFDKAMWESQSECGFVQIDFNPETGEQTGVAVNALQSSIWNMSSKDLLEMITNFDMPLMSPKSDLLFLLVDEICNEFRDKERFYRIFTSPDQPRSAILVHHSTTRRFNAVGQCYMVITIQSKLCALFDISLQVRYLCRPINTAEYDDKLRTTKEMCPLYVSGDLRSGAELLAECDADAEQEVWKLPQANIFNLVEKLNEKCRVLMQKLVSCRTAISDPDTCYDLTHEIPSSSEFPALSHHVQEAADRRAPLANFAQTLQAMHHLNPAPSPPLGIVAGIFLNSAAEAALHRVTQELSIGLPLVAGIRSAYRIEELLEMVDALPQGFKCALKRAAEAVQVRPLLVLSPSRAWVCVDLGEGTPFVLSFVRVVELAVVYYIIAHPPCRAQSHGCSSVRNDRFKETCFGNDE